MSQRHLGLVSANLEPGLGMSVEQPLQGDLGRTPWHGAMAKVGKEIEQAALGYV